MMTADAVSVVVPARRAVKVGGVQSLAVVLATNAADHVVIKVQEAALHAMIAVATAGMIVVGLPNAAKYPHRCRKSTLPSCPMKRALSPWRARSR